MKVAAIYPAFAPVPAIVLYDGCMRQLAYGVLENRGGVKKDTSGWRCALPTGLVKRELVHHRL